MTAAKPHFSFWIAATAGLLWHLLGCLNFITQSNPQAVAMMPELQQIIITGRPGWATASAALAAFGGAAGCILLLLRQRVAFPVLILSFVGAMLTAAFLAQVLGLVPSVVLSILVSGALLWYASIARRAGWLH